MKISKQYSILISDCSTLRIVNNFKSLACSPILKTFTLLLKQKEARLQWYDLYATNYTATIFDFPIEYSSLTVKNLYNKIPNNPYPPNAHHPNPQLTLKAPYGQDVFLDNSDEASFFARLYAPICHFFSGKYSLLKS